MRVLRPAYPANKPSYATAFNANETPIAEGGVWTNAGATGLDWNNVNTSGGLAFGTQPGNGAFTDSTACLSGFSPDVSIRATVHRSASFSPGATTREVEILFRWQISAHRVCGYECTLPYDGSYSGIVRWDGPLATGEGAGFTTLLVGPTGWGGLANGDIVSGTMIGNVIIVKINGSQLMTVDVSAGGGASQIWTRGNPGMGFWRNGAPTGTDADSDFCFSDFAAVSL